MLAQVEWGNAAEWVAAVGTVGALLLTYSLLRKELREFRNAQEDRTMAQATSVAGWAEPRREPHGMEEDQRWVVLVHNASPAPVYDCVATFIDHSSVDPRRELVFGTVPPGRVADFSTGEFVDGCSAVAWPEVELHFTDTRGVHWRRDGNGRLQRVEEPASGYR